MALRTIHTTLSQRRPSLSSLLLLTLTLLLFFTSPTYARQQPTSYCKCICFTNSTIIPLNSPPPQSSSSTTAHRIVRDEQESSSSSSDGSGGATHHRQLSCADCNRAFCLDYNLPICKNAKEEDVFTQCFQRDSLKDETVVVLFLFCTTGLLGWAVLKPWIDRMRDRDHGQSVLRSSRSEGERQSLPTTRMSGRLRGGGSSANAEYDEEDDHDTHQSRPIRSGRPAANSLSRQGGLNS